MPARDQGPQSGTNWCTVLLASAHPADFSPRTRTLTQLRLDTRMVEIMVPAVNVAGLLDSARWCAATPRLATQPAMKQKLMLCSLSAQCLEKD
jgi:hypothetical protein